MLQLEDVLAVYSFSRIGTVITQWSKLQSRTADIFSQRNRFVSILNSMFLNKQAEIGESNEIFFRGGAQQMLTPLMLSSGEKQLFILLGETFLQRNQPYVFITDEPELSLHVKWQEQLIGNLRSLNDAAQIVAATHSPDIVGALGDRAIDKETILK